jgi:cob(I)alamin adenosyltransferase
LTYLNRLSDALFVLGRYLSHETGAGDKVWVPNVPAKNGID